MKLPEFQLYKIAHKRNILFLSYLLEGEVPIDFDKALDSSDEDIVQLNPGTETGGSSRPHGCVARHRVAVIIPYRDRRQQLQGLLYYLHPMLQKQQLDYTIFVVEQVNVY